jgi:hypothetical protein
MLHGKLLWMAGFYARMSRALIVPVVTDPWTCPTCRREADTPYCPACGERRRDPRELSLASLAGQTFEALTSVDGRLLRSFRCLITSPGSLTVAFVEGRRKPFLGPVALFLVANVVFFAVESMSHGLVFSTPLQSHLDQQPWSAIAQPMVAGRLAALRTTAALYAPRFDAAVALHARSMILLMAVAFAPLPALVFRRLGRPFAAHVVFSLHLYAFMLLVFSIGTPIPELPVLAGGTRSTSQLLDTVLSIVLLIACAIYLHRAVGTVYGGTPATRALSTALLTTGVAAIVLTYRFALFVITLYTA